MKKQNKSTIKKNQKQSKFKNFMDEKFPGSIATRFVDKQVHPGGLLASLVCCLIILIALVSILGGSGKYSHPIHKYNMVHSCKTVVSPRKRSIIKAGMAQENKQLSSNYYQMGYNPKTNIITMQLGDGAEKDVQKANDGNQSHQAQLTQVEMSTLIQSKRFSTMLNDKKLGYQIFDPNGTMLCFAQNGKIRYSVLPSLGEIK